MIINESSDRTAGETLAVEMKGLSGELRVGGRGSIGWSLLVVAVMIGCGWYLFYDSGEDEKLASFTAKRLQEAQDLAARCDSAVERTAAECLRVVLEAPAAGRSREGGSMEVAWTISNSCLKTVYFLPRDTPLEGILGLRGFEVRPLLQTPAAAGDSARMGRALPYEGPVVKRTPPASEELREVRAGHEVGVGQIELGEAFSIDRAHRGFWSIDWESSVFFASFEPVYQVDSSWSTLRSSNRLRL